MIKWREWAVRLGVLVGVSVAVATVDAFILRPPPPVPPPVAPSADGTPAPATNAMLLEDLVVFFEAGNGFLIDARPIDQYREGHIPGAFHIDVDAFRQGRPEVLDFLPTDAEIVIYCGGGECDASHMVERMLQSHGYTNLKIFEPGYPAWEKAGQPVEKGDPSS